MYSEPSFDPGLLGKAASASRISVYQWIVVTVKGKGGMDYITISTTIAAAAAAAAASATCGCYYTLLLLQLSSSFSSSAFLSYHYYLSPPPRRMTTTKEHHTFFLSSDWLCVPPFPFFLPPYVDSAVVPRLSSTRLLGGSIPQDLHFLPLLLLLLQDPDFSSYR